MGVVFEKLLQIRLLREEKQSSEIENNEKKSTTDLRRQRLNLFENNYTRWSPKTKQNPFRVVNKFSLLIVIDREI